MAISPLPRVYAESKLLFSINLALASAKWTSDRKSVVDIPVR